MADNDTNVNDEGVDTVNNVSDTKGSEGSDTQKTEKVHTQKEVDAIIRQKHAEWSSKSKKEFEKSLEGKHVLTEDDLVKMRTELEKEFSTKMEFDNKRKGYKAQGLSDAQLDVIQVTKVEDYDSKVKELYGALLKKDAPVLNGGTSPKDEDSGDTNKSLNDWLRQGLKHKKV